MGTDTKIYTAASYDGPVTRDGRAYGHGWVGWILLLTLFVTYYVAYFSPVLVHGGTLAPGDGEVYYLSYFDLPIFQFWNDSILSGFPVIADIQAMTLYPLRWFSTSYNVLVLAAYVVAAMGTFGLALSQTGSRLAALFAAFVVSGSGFMVGHLGHLGIIHSAAWVPVILWALTTLSTALSWRATGCGAIAVAMCVLGGHPQISITGLSFAGTYALLELVVVARSRGRSEASRLFVRIFLLFLIGLLMASPTLVGTLKSAVGGMRGNWSVGEFNSFSHDWSSLRMAFLPHLYGAHPNGPFGGYTGPFNITELALYAGLLPWMLACFALPLCRRDPRVAFWALCVLASFLLCVGTLTPLGRLLYELPVFGRFRAQARFGHLGILCLAVLSAYGLSALLSGALIRRAKQTAATLLAALLVAAITWLAIGVPANGPSGVTLGLKVSAVFAAAGLVMLALVAWRRSHVAALVLIAIATLDVAGFGWFYEWRYASPTLTPLAPDVARLVDTMKASGGRLLPFGAERWGPNPLRPNINMRYDLPSVVGYGPLLSARYAAATGADTVGGFPRVSLDAPLLDVLGIRWVAGELQDTQPVLMGAGCGLDTGVDRVKAVLPPNVPLRAVRVVSHMSCSQSLRNGHPVARVEFAGVGTATLQQVITAGEGTAEWAWDRADVRGSVAHARARVVDTFEAEGARGLWFDSTLDVPDEPSRGQSIVVALMDDNVVPFKIRSIEYQDDAGTWHPVPVGADAPGDVGRLSAPRLASGVPAVRERGGYVGAAWSVCSVRYVPQHDMGTMLRSRQQLDARRTALVEQPVTLVDACRTPPRVSIRGYREGHWHLRSEGAGASLIVVSNAYDDGWRAEVDGVPVSVLPLYGVVMGVMVPDGSHDIVLSYRPRWLVVTLAFAAMSTLSALLMLALGVYTPPLRLQNIKDKEV